MLPAGSLRNRVVIESPSSSQDSIGQPTISWSTFATVWASIRQLAGLDAIKAGLDVDIGATRASIRIRWLAGVTAGMRVTHGSDIYDIKGVQYDQVGKEFVDLICVLGANNG